jgi:hypothetical protein
MSLPVPSWLRRLPADRQRYALRRYLLRSAALLATEDGHIHDLERAVGLARRSLGVFMTLEKKKAMPRRLADKVETVTRGAVLAVDLMDEPEA